MTTTFESRLIRLRLAAGYDPRKGSMILAERFNEQKQAAA